MPAPKFRRVYPTEPGAHQGNARFSAKAHFRAARVPGGLPIAPPAIFLTWTSISRSRKPIRRCRRTFFARSRRLPVASPRLIKLNRRSRSSSGRTRTCCRPGGPPKSSPKTRADGADPSQWPMPPPVRQFVPQLGDGRAILLGEVIDQDGAAATSSSRDLARRRSRARRRPPRSARLLRNTSSAGDVRTRRSTTLFVRRRRHRRTGPAEIAQPERC